MDRVYEPESAEGVSARSAEGHFISVTSGAAVADQAACTVNRDKTVDFISIFREEMAHSAQIPETFLTDIAADDDVSDRFQPGFCDGSCHGEDLSKSAGIITDSRSVDLRSFPLYRERSIRRENGV